MDRRVTTIFGGSGFIGRHLVRRLAAAGGEIRVAVRNPEGAAHLKPLGDAGQLVLWRTEITDAAQVATAVAGADTVVNLVGILYESGHNTFLATHTEAAGAVASAARAAGVKRLVHVSAIGANAESRAQYALTKAAGEALVMDIFSDVTIVRPSVVFGQEDNFFNMFAGLARLSPILPLFGCPQLPKVSFTSEDGQISLSLDLYGDGGTKFQPGYVGDGAEAITVILGDNATRGKLYELVAKAMSPDKVMEYGNKGIDAAADAVSGLVKPVDGFGPMDEKAEAEAAEAFIKALNGWAAEEAKEW